MNQYIVTHPGGAHRDEVLACALILGARPHGPLMSIERREPTENEIDHPDVWVVDTGGAHSPSLRCFDHHHQFERGTVSSAALLVAQHLGLDEHMRDAYPWWDATHRMDSLGGAATARHYGLDSHPSWAWGGPFEAALLAMFGSASRHDEQSTVVMALRLMGLELVRHAREHAAKVEECWACHAVEEHAGLGVLYCSRPVSPSASSSVIRALGERGTAIAILVAPDDRGPGWTLLRIDDHPRVDFRRIDGHEDCAFAHQGGFVAKTRHRDESWRDLVALAIADGTDGTAS